MDIIVTKSILNGVVSIPPSKSYSHRHLILAMLSKDKKIVQGVNLCDDIRATLNVALNLGCHIEMNGNDIFIDSTSLFQKNNVVMDVYASGATLRFFIPICLVNKGRYRFYLRDRLKERSLQVYEQLFKQCTFTKKEDLLEIDGVIEPGYYEVDGSHSSQFLSGLFFALPLLDGDSEVVIKEPFVSKDYFEMTLACLKKAGIQIETVHQHHYKVKGNQKYHYEPFTIESDASAAVYIKVAQYLGHHVYCEMDQTHHQKDAMIDDFLEKIKKGSCKIDVSDCPDVVPGLALAMALTPSHFEIVGANRLKDKESNRLVAISHVLNTLGANIDMTDEGLSIHGVSCLKGGTVDSYQDHRIAMMAVIAGLSSSQPLILKNADCISKSWPTFYQQIRKVGGNIHEL